LPFDAILDDRLDGEVILTRLDSAAALYIVALYNSVQGLSAGESALLSSLQDGRIEAQHTRVGETDVWIVTQAGRLDLP
jgi:hypothetical protein